MPKKMPRVWTPDELAQGLATSIDLFRSERLSEPHQQYRDRFDEAYKIADDVFVLTDDLTRLYENASSVLASPPHAELARYLVSPPISKDDLETIAGTTMAVTLVAAEPKRGKALMEILISGLDERRFPWFGQKRKPTPAERRAALVATAAMLAFRQVETTRRNQGKTGQEEAVKEFLRTQCGFAEVAPRLISGVKDMPDPGTFCGESEVGSRKADIVIGLYDNRIMPIECKVSNSATNSYKRINNDAAVKAVVWREELGKLHVVPAAVLGGVFALNNLTYAQANQLYLFWAHDLDKLAEFVDLAR